ncbi:MAG TPA: ImmA/IrrE family metallo-endopeptidase [Clostridiales bacterium]|nr:ImmA/IrrE family metallo-endopeptidase [Clostridiales bacterium]
MSNFGDVARSINDAEKLANMYLQYYFKGKEISYPINPFQMLLNEDVRFVMRDFGKLEGVYIPAENTDDIDIVGINFNRPITRQRFTAAHELCHYFREPDQQMCPISGKKTNVEKYADAFAAGILMPIKDLRAQVKKRLNGRYIDFDDVLIIADYFGVSFETCLFRIAYKIHAISGNTESRELKKRAQKYRPDDRRKDLGLNNVILYEGLIDSYTHALCLKPTTFMFNVFQNDYIYNDSRMEGVDTDIETASEIVTDIRLNKQGSQYCSEENEAYLSIAGHSVMYNYIFETAGQDRCSVYDTIILNRKLFSYFPHPEFGGNLRQTNTLVLGAKFETIDYHEIMTELSKINSDIDKSYECYAKQPISDYIKFIVKLHHKLTVIHPFVDGNGRTLRAFFNTMLIRNRITPMYIKVENKDEYLKALSIADLNEDYVPLYEFFFKMIIRSNSELTRDD